MVDNGKTGERVPALSRKAPVLAALATITTTAALATFGPGLALAQAGCYQHNEVLVTR